MFLREGGGEAGGLIRATEWDGTPLGAVERWPAPLRTLVGVMLGANQPMFVVWGVARTLLYNDAYGAILGDKHPAAMGRDFLEVWAEVRADIQPIVAEAYAGRAIHMDDIRLVMNRRGHPEETHFAFSYTPVRDDDDAVGGFFCACQEITEQVRAQRLMRESEERLRLLIEGATDYVILTTDRERRVTSWSRGAEATFGYAADEIVGSPADVLFTPEDCAAGVPEAEMGQARHEGFAPDVRWHLRKNGSRVFLNGAVRPLHDGAGRLAGFLKIARDETERFDAARRLAESEASLRIAVDVAGVGIMESDLVSGTTRWSPEVHRIAGTPDEGPMPIGAGGKLVHPDDRARLTLVSRGALAPGGTGEAAGEYRIVRPDGEQRWLQAKVRTFFEGEGADKRPVRSISAVRDVTDEKRAEAALRETEERYRLAARATNDAIWDWNLRTDRVRWNEAVCALFGYAPGDVGPSGAWWKDNIHPDDRERVAAGIHQVIDGDAENWTYEYRFRRADGSFADVLDRGTVLRDADGRALRMVSAMLDLTDRRAAEHALREETRTLETLNRTGAALAAELDLERVVQMVTDAGVALTGARFGAYFHNVMDDSGERLHLYTLSGAERAAFEAMGRPRATAIFGPTFRNEGVIRSDNITADPRYGRNAPHQGMPTGHLPVRSYLAVPVVSRSGEVLGGLLFGHPEPGRFTDRHERLMTGLAAQAAVAIDNARLYAEAQRELEERRRAEEQLRDLNETLEARVEERTRELMAAEEALRQAQKMEAVGQLTGGIAHDFNNLLQIVTGNLETLQRRLPEGEERLRRAAENAQTGAQRAAVLTQRLLAFSRRQPLAPKAVDANELVRGMSDLLHRALGETIELRTALSADLWRVEADPNQLENALLNLAVNARDAMPDGGKLTVETRNAMLDDRAAGHADLPPGRYVAIAVSDTGTGMDKDTLERVFEPFFTTKEVGKGTGLGLSMTYGFAKQSGGHVRIYSEPGLGTTVELFLPRLQGEAREVEEEANPTLHGGASGETVLVCEDDPDVRSYSVEALRELGYQVLEAADGAAALALLGHPAAQVDLLFTDVVLPGGMSGAQLAEEARRLRPGLRVLFTTGYARDAIVHHGRLDPGVELLTKPFSYADLAARVREVLDG
ncbi:MAG: hypothetical protein AVDCRST_MAG39-272 [uncultured Sphingomonadaceae bacterium]|uniref:histidine kinase n=1 Tax=uncultured Sphingomonadaceae bacterium TaxID=169976 RepID=A0A6J4RYG7_9SPHN|nr:MAG: hypothetical protein AVDCRST_MAG39-272 [uncultured Sphingomonadaceae bacterium]